DPGPGRTEDRDGLPHRQAPDEEEHELPGEGAPTQPAASALPPAKTYPVACAIPESRAVSRGWAVRSPKRLRDSTSEPPEPAAATGIHSSAAPGARTMPTIAATEQRLTTTPRARRSVRPRMSVDRSSPALMLTTWKRNMCQPAAAGSRPKELSTVGSQVMRTKKTPDCSPMNALTTHALGSRHTGAAGSAGSPGGVRGGRGVRRARAV